MGITQERWDHLRAKLYVVSADCFQKLLGVGGEDDIVKLGGDLSTSISLSDVTACGQLFSRFTRSRFLLSTQPSSDYEANLIGIVEQ